MLNESVRAEASLSVAVPPSAGQGTSRPPAARTSYKRALFAYALLFVIGVVAGLEGLAALARAR